MYQAARADKARARSQFVWYNQSDFAAQPRYVRFLYMKKIVIIIFIAIFAVCLWFFLGRYLPGHGFADGESGVSFSAGDQRVIITYGYTDWRDRLTYIIIRSWPNDASPGDKLNDKRVVFGFNGWRIRDQRGELVPVRRDGTVYFYFDKNLRTMKVEMNEYEDTVGVMSSNNLEEVWDFFERFRVDKET